MQSSTGSHGWNETAGDGGFLTGVRRGGEFVYFGLDGVGFVDGPSYPVSYKRVEWWNTREGRLAVSRKALTSDNIHFTVYPDDREFQTPGTETPL